jgi:serine/threonine protein kinase
MIYAQFYRYLFISGAFPFEGHTLQLLRDRVLSGRYRIPYYMSSGNIYIDSIPIIYDLFSDCEHLIRRMLTLDPLKRYTIDQIKRHKWMQAADVNVRTLPIPNPLSVVDTTNEPCQQILKLMQSLGIDANRTKEVSGVFSTFVYIGFSRCKTMLTTILPPSTCYCSTVGVLRQ